jgi:hypothetical protein
MKMSKRLIKIIIAALLSALFGYQAGNPDSMARAYLLPEPHEEVPTAHCIDKPELP